MLKLIEDRELNLVTLNDVYDADGSGDTQ